MPKLNFKEIPQGNIANGKQDTFELFCRDFFEMLGFTIDVNPDRGQDGGRDLIIIEKRSGLLNTTEIRWLVSCKHKAHSQKSVSVSDEEDINDRVQAHNCSGFIGFYSTIISSGLNRKLQGLRIKCEIQIFDNEKIESVLLNSEGGISLIERYFPSSYTDLQKIIPSNIFSSYKPLKCKHCGRDLIASDFINKKMSIIIFVQDTEYADDTKEMYTDVFWCCKGSCDRELEKSFKGTKYITKWEDISDIKIPYQYLKWIMAIINRLRDNTDLYSDQAFDQLKEFILIVSQIVLKSQTNEELKRILMLHQIPDNI